ncbi:MAG: diguanylate cyclase, partial [Pseudomonadota bacterium]|nr:diguanylate cyclase [Pseudomonadota bacterium]
LSAGLIAALAARVLAGDGLTHAAVLTLANLVEILLVAGSVRRHIGDVGRPSRWMSLGRIATVSTLVACAVSGVIAAFAVAVLQGAAFSDNFMIWYPAHVIGMVLVATLTAVAHREGTDVFGRAGRRGEFAVSMLLIAIVVSAVFSQSRFPLLFLTFPPLLWAAYRHRFAGVLIGITVLAIISALGTALGLGPAYMVSDLGETERVFLVQAFIGAACLLTFPVALVMAERAQLAARVRDSEAHYRMLADYSHDVVVRMRADGRRLYVSPSAKDILGHEPADLLTSRWGMVHPDDRTQQRGEMASLLADGIPRTSRYRVQHKDGHYVWFESVGRLIPSVDRAGAMDIILAARNIDKRVAAEESLKASRQELELLARADSLTGLANRRQFDERLALALARSRRHGTPITLLFLDIDYFKRINDSLGHLAGDAVLKEFARRLSACVRAEDLLARLGGDEFVMLVEDAATTEYAEVIARKLIECVIQPSQVDGADTSITTSIGIAFCLRATSAEELLWYADKALYVAKGNGRNTFHLVTME